VPEDANRVDAESLLEAIGDGDLAALEQLYRELRVPVYAVALAITADRSLAEDVSQDVFVRVYRSARTYRPGSRPRAWVLAIARNLALDALRRRRRELPAEEPASLASTSKAPFPGDDATVARLELTAALLELGVTERQIVVLHDVAGLTHAEIAGGLGLPPGTVRWKYRLALAHLQTTMKGSRDG
jgi:RNA polymerase sigma factor (sigma-70 family)